ALTRGLCAEAGYVGVLMPSVDRVGRYFPLIAAVELPPGVAPASAFALEGWYAAVEEVLLDALSNEALELETFDARLAALAPLLAPAAALAGDLFTARDALLFETATQPRHYALSAVGEAP